MSRLTRRAALAAALLPSLARADDAPVATPPVAPTIPAGPQPPRPPPLTATTPAPTPAIDNTKAYYVYFDQAIDVASMRALRRQCTTLVEAGVSEINVVFHSNGGLLDPTLTTYSYLRALPATINMHGVGFIASAANLLFLAGERRTADRNTRFLFHPSVAPFAGTMSAEQMRDRLTQFNATAAAITDAYRDRTTLSDTELARFGREEVIYTAQQALDAGILHAITDLRIPGPGKARVVFLD